MMLFEPGLNLRVEELPSGPRPLPLDSGFSTGKGDLAMGLNDHLAQLSMEYSHEQAH